VYQSSPFYSHHNGYRLCFSAGLVCHCRYCTEQQPVDSCFNEDTSLYYFPFPHSKPSKVHGSHSLSITLSTVKGEHDVKLKWPFQKRIAINLLNDKSDTGHYSITKEYKGTLAGSALQIVPSEPGPKQDNTEPAGQKVYKRKPKSNCKQALQSQHHREHLTQHWLAQSEAQGYMRVPASYNVYKSADCRQEEHDLISFQDKSNPNSILFPFDADAYIAQNRAQSIPTTMENYMLCECNVYFEITF